MDLQLLHAHGSFASVEHVWFYVMYEGYNFPLPCHDSPHEER